MARFQARRPNGTLVRWAAAFADIWSALQCWCWLAYLTRLPGILPVLDPAYVLFLRIRSMWQKPTPH